MATWRMGTKVSASTAVSRLALGGLLALGIAAPALGQAPGGTGAARVTQEQDPTSDPSGRHDPERVDESFQPRGVEVGSFLLFPLLELEQGYNDNVFAADTNELGDWVTRVSPELKLRSRFQEHALNVLARVDDVRYWEYTDDNHTNANLFTDGRYDLSRTWEATAALDLTRRSEDRGSPDDAQGVEPTLVHSGMAKLGTKSVHGRYTLSGDVAAVRQIHDDVSTSRGTVINNGDRDRNEYEARGRIGYEVYPGYAALFEVSGNRRLYDDERDDMGVKRSSHGYRVETGVGVDLTNLVRGDFLIGYMAQDYEDRRLSDPQGLALRATLNWTPSRMTVVVPSLERSVQETTSLNTSAVVRSRAGLLVRHELQRNIVLTGIANLSYEEFEGIDREDTLAELRGRMIWALAPEYYVGGEVGYRHRYSTNATSEYDQWVTGLRFGLRM